MGADTESQESENSRNSNIPRTSVAGLLKKHARSRYDISMQTLKSTVKENHKAFSVIDAQSSIHLNILKVVNFDLEGSVNYKDLMSEFSGCFLYIQNTNDITGTESKFEENIQEENGLDSIPKKTLRKVHIHKDLTDRRVNQDNPTRP